MQAFLVSVTWVFLGVLVALFVAGFFYTKMTRDWRLHLANGICLVVLAACSLLNMILYKQQRAGMGDGFWLALYVVVAVVCFGSARRLRRMHPSEVK